MAFIDEWRQWHAARADALAAPYGPLSAMCGIRVRGSAGAEARSGDVEHLIPIRAPGLEVHEPWRARLLRIPLGVEDDSVEVDGLTAQQRNLIEAEGVFALDAIEDRIHRITFGGLKVFEPHHDWVMPAEAVSLPPEEAVRIAAPCTDGHDRRMVLDARIRFEIDGRTFELAATREPRGAFHAIFSDHTRSSGFPFRNLHIPAPDAGEGLTTIDFNRAVLPLAALSTRFPAMSAPPGNHLDIAITAGEHRPYLDAPAPHAVG